MIEVILIGISFFLLAMGMKFFKVKKYRVSKYMKFPMLTIFKNKIIFLRRFKFGQNPMWKMWFFKITKTTFNFSKFYIHTKKQFYFLLCVLYNIYYGF